jgi:hypothetical protein
MCNKSVNEAGLLCVIYLLIGLAELFVSGKTESNKIYVEFLLKFLLIVQVHSVIQSIPIEHLLCGGV